MTIRCRRLLVFGLDERIRYGLHAVHRAYEDDGRAPTNHEPQVPGIVRELKLVVGI